MRDSLPEGIELPDFSAQPDFGKPAEAHHPPRRRQRLHRPQAVVDAGPPQPDRRDRLLPDHARRHLRPSLRHRVVHRGRAAPPRDRWPPSCSSPSADAGDARTPGPTPATRSRSSSAPGRCERSRACCGRSALRRVMLVTTEGRHDSDDGRAGAGRHRPGARRRPSPRSQSHVPAPLVQRRCSQARRDGVDGVVCFGGGLVRRPGQGGVLLHRAGDRARPAPPTPTGRRCRTCRCRRPTRAPSSRRSSA